MEKDFESWLHHRQLNEQLPNAKFLELPFDDLGMRNTGFPCAIPCTVTAPTNGALPAYGFSGMPNIKTGQLKEPHGWFYCLPRSRQQGLIPDGMLQDKFTPKTDLPGKVPAAANASSGEVHAITPTTGSGHTVKQFLVFDQTGNKTTMMLSSGIGTSIPRPTAWSLKPSSFYNCKEDEHRIRSDGHYSGPNLTDELDDEHGTDEESNMREDSEEINALLYSDDEDDCSDDDEETSTGHSPSTMTAPEKQDWFDEEDMDEVASSAGSSKRQKLSESDLVPSVTYTASCVKPNISSEYEDDAESSCAGGKPVKSTDMGSLPGNKRMRREKIRETVNILQTILPGRKGKDAVMVLDEAINYLRTLKFKAEALGLSGGSE